MGPEERRLLADGPGDGEDPRLGLDVEAAVLASLVASLRERDPARPIEAALVHTKSNMPCRTVYANAGFVEHAERWTLPPDQAPAAIPAHVQLTRRTALAPA